MQKSIYTAQQAAFTDLLRRVRREAGLTQAELAERLGTHQSRITDYERGVRRMDLMELRQVCEAVGIPLLEFVRRFEETAVEQPGTDAAMHGAAGGSGNPDGDP